MQRIAMMLYVNKAVIEFRLREKAVRDILGIEPLVHTEGIYDVLSPNKTLWGRTRDFRALKRR